MRERGGLVRKERKRARDRHRDRDREKEIYIDIYGEKGIEGALRDRGPTRVIERKGQRDRKRARWIDK